MNNYQLATPVAFIIFNRPEIQRKAFEKIREARPTKLFVIADGARPERVGEIDKCRQCRTIVDEVDWECEVMTNFSEVNLGCKDRVSTGLDWVFSLVEEAIILEDDCVPDSSFFRFCEEMLWKYRENEQIMMISGSNFLKEMHREKFSYRFSIFSDIWGWATWKRAWKHYDIEMKQWPRFHQEGVLYDLMPAFYAKIWEETLQHVYQDKINSWAYRWTFAGFLKKGLSVAPNVNLVSNIGFTEEATHTKNADILYANMKANCIEFPLKHPYAIQPCRQADVREMKVIYYEIRKISVYTYVRRRASFRRAIKNLICQYVENREIVVFAAGADGIKAYQFLRDAQLKIKCIVDNSKSKQGKEIDGIPIHSPSVLYKDKGNILVLIASSKNVQDIEKELIDKGLKQNKDYYIFNKLIDVMIKEYIYTVFLKKYDRV